MFKQKSKLLASVLRVSLASILLVGAIAGTLTTLTRPEKVRAATSSTLNFQARLLTSSGGLVADGNYNVEFKVYNASSSSGSSQGSCSGDAACLWTETRTTSNKVRVANGYLTVNLGSVTAFSSTINWDQEMWLTMNIGGTGTPGWDGEMTPRLKLTAVPYAFRAGRLANTNGANQSTLGWATQTASNSILLPNEAGTLCIQSSTNCGFAPSSGSSNYIRNGTSAQTANFYIQSAAAGSVVATLQGAVGQTGAYLVMRNSDSTPVAVFDEFGNLFAQQLASNDTITANVYSSDHVALDAIQHEPSATVAVARIQGGATPGTAADLLQFRNSGGAILAKFDRNGQLTLGRVTSSGTTQAGSIILADGTTDNFGLTLNTATLTNNRTISLPDEAGTICIRNSSNCGFATSGSSGVTTVGTINSQTKSSNGAVISGANLYMQTADASSPGLLSTGSQTIAGAKTFNSSLNVASGQGYQINGGNVLTASSLSFTAASTADIQSAASRALTITGHAASTWSTDSGLLTLQGAGGVTMTATGTNAVTVDSAGAGSVLLGTANATTVTLGNTGSTTTSIQGNTAINIGTSSTGGTITIGSSSASGATTLQSGSGNVNILTNSASAKVVIKSGVNDDTAFQVQNASNNALLTVDTSGSQVVFGTASTVTGKMLFQNGTNANTITVQSGTTGSSYALTLPTALSGGAGDCLKDTTGAGVLGFASCGGSGSTLQGAYDSGNTITTTSSRDLTVTLADTATDSKFAVNMQCTTCSASGGRFEVQNGGTAVFWLNPGTAAGQRGSAVFKNSANDANALQVQNASSLSLFNIDSSGTQVEIGSDSTDANAVTLVLDSYNQSSDPTGVNGAMYYSTNTNTFRCHQNGVWQDCIGSLKFANTAISSSITATSPTAFSISGYAPTIPANFCTAGRVIHVVAFGTYNNSAGAARTFTTSVRLGSSVVGTAAAHSMPQDTLLEYGWGIDLYIVCNAAPGASVALNSQGFGWGVTATSGTVTPRSMTFASTVNFATNSALQINIYGQVNGTLASATLRQFIVTAL